MCSYPMNSLFKRKLFENIWKVITKELSEGELDWNEDNFDVIVTSIGAHLMSKAYNLKVYKKGRKLKRSESDLDSTVELEE